MSRQYLLLSLVLFLEFALQPLQALTLYFKDGSSLECESAFFEGEYARVKIDIGEIRVPVANLSEKTFNEMAGEKPAAKKEEPKPQSPVSPDAEQKPEGETKTPEKGTAVSGVLQAPVVDAPVASGPRPVPLGWKPVPFTELQSDLPAPDTKYKILEDEIELSGKPKSGLIGDKAKVKYRMAMLADGKTPGPHASQLLFYGPTFDEPDPPKGRETAAYTDVLGFTAFSFQIRTKFTGTYDPSQAYWMPEAGWFELVMEAAEKIRKKHGLKEEKMFGWGNSAGAGMIQRLAVRYPDKFSAVGLMGGSAYETLEKATGIPWLLCNTWGASEQPDNLKLLAGLRKVGDTAIYTQAPPLREARGSVYYYHTAGPLALSMAQSYFWALYQKREQDGTVSAPERWPLAARGSSPFEIYRIIPGSSLPEPMEDDEWFRLPSLGLSYFWTQRQPSMVTEKLLLATGRSVPLMLARPISNGPKPKGLVITTTEFDYQRYQVIANDLSHWSEEGYVALAFRSGKSSLTKNGQEIPWKELAGWIKSRPDLASLPLYLSVMDGQSLPLDAWKTDILKSRLSAVTVTNINADDPAAKTREILEKYDLGRPWLVTVYTEEEDKDKSKPKDDKKKKESDEKESLEKRIGRRFADMANPPLIYLSRATRKDSEIRQTFAIRKAAAFFADSP